MGGKGTYASCHGARPLTRTSRPHSPPLAPEEPEPRRPCRAHLPGRVHEVPRGDEGGSHAEGGHARRGRRSQCTTWLWPRGPRESGWPRSPQLKEHSKGQAGLRHPVPPSPTAGAGVPARRAAPGINCMAPGCRQPGALSGSESAPGRRGPRHPPLGSRPRAHAPGGSGSQVPGIPAPCSHPPQPLRCPEAGGRRSPSRPERAR